MKWLVWLYPRKWRIRYEDEFSYILERRKLSFKEVIDIFINAIDAQFLSLVEVIIIMLNKLNEIMLKSVFKRSLIIGSIMILGVSFGYWISGITPSLSQMSTKTVLIVGVVLGLCIGYIIGQTRGIMRVIKVTQNKDVFLPTGKLKFEKIEK